MRNSLGLSLVYRQGIYLSEIQSIYRFDGNLQFNIRFQFLKFPGIENLNVSTDYKQKPFGLWTTGLKLNYYGKDNEIKATNETSPVVNRVYEGKYIYLAPLFNDTGKPSLDYLSDF